VLRAIISVVICMTINLFYTQSAWASTNTGLQVSPGRLTIQQKAEPNSDKLVAPYAITNKGTDTLIIHITPNGLLHESVTDFSLKPGQFKFVYVYLDVPKDAALGAHTDYVMVHAHSPSDPRNTITVKDRVTYDVGMRSIWTQVGEFLTTHKSQISVGFIAIAFIVGLWMPKPKRRKRTA
jgi:hypothetical protein